MRAPSISTPQDFRSRRPFNGPAEDGTPRRPQPPVRKPGAEGSGRLAPSLAASGVLLGGISDQKSGDWPGIAALDFSPAAPNPNDLPDPLPQLGHDRSPGIPQPHCMLEFDIWHRLVHRTTFGPTREELDFVYSRGYDAYIEHQLDYEAIDDRELDLELRRRFPTLFLSLPYILRNRDALGLRPDEDLVYSTILRAIKSRRQLFERTVDFWSDHFNTYLYKDGVETRKVVEDRDVIRRHAYGKFGDMLNASARSPAMLLYLDNAFSYAGEPNQNYARELLELHTLGVDHYSQTDVEEIARCFTGWGVNWDENSDHYGEFYFDAGNHDDGEKTVLGYTLRAGGGISDGEKVLDILLHAPDVAPITARFVAAKMARYFWGASAPEALIGDIAAAFLATDGDIRSMLRVVLSARWMVCSRPKLKRPQHLAYSVMRALPSTINHYGYLGYILDLMGQYPFLWSPPDGYPDSTEYWSGHLLPRWNFGTFLLFEQSDIALDLRRYESLAAITPLQAINEDFFGGAIPAAEASRLAEYGAADPESSHRIKETITLAIASPAFQWY